MDNELIIITIKNEMKRNKNLVRCKFVMKKKKVQKRNDELKCKPEVVIRTVHN